MKINRVESQESDNQMYDIDENGYSSKKYSKNVEYIDRKIKSKKRPNFNRYHDHPKTSTYSSSSRFTSFLKGNSISEAQIAPFKSSESAYFNQLTQKYVTRGATNQKVKQEMELALQRKTSQIESLRVHRDELKFISYNNPYDMPVKISLQTLKNKARAEEKIKDFMLLLQKDIKQIEFELNTMTDYYNFITSSIKNNGEEDLIIDSHEEQKLMIQNLEKETNHLFRQLKEEDKKNAKEIKTMQDEIGMLRVYIKQKEDKIRDLKSKICTMHIKLHSRTGSSSKEKSMSLSIRKFINEQNNSIQEAFIGNKNFKHYSKQIIQKITNNGELVRIIFYYDKKREEIIFKCMYKHHEGKIHSIETEVANSNGSVSPPQDHKNKAQTTEIKIKYLLSMKFFFKSKVVGVECRLKNERGNEHVQIGNCANYLQHELLTLINKKVVTLGSFWHQKEMIGVGVWFTIKNSQKNNNSNDNKDSKQNGLIKQVKSTDNLQKRKETQFEYYNN